MQLHFHGATYEYNPTIVETIETGITAQFRGIEYQIRHSQKPLPQTKKQLVYRGITYCTHTHSRPINRVLVDHF